MAENENLASILVKSGLISIFTNSPIGYFSKFANALWLGKSNQVVLAKTKKSGFWVCGHNVGKVWLSKLQRVEVSSLSGVESIKLHQFNQKVEIRRTKNEALGALAFHSIALG